MTLHPRFTCAAIALSLACGGCGVDKCITLGYPAASVTAVNASTGAPVSLAGAIVVQTVGLGPSKTDTLPSTWPPSAPFSICCTSGTLRLQISVADYVSADTTVTIRTTGACRIPVFIDVVLQLRHPLAIAARLSRVNSRGHR